MCLLTAVAAAGGKGFAASDWSRQQLLPPHCHWHETDSHRKRVYIKILVCNCMKICAYFEFKCQSSIFKLIEY